MAGRSSASPTTGLGFPTSAATTSSSLTSPLKRAAPAWGCSCRMASFASIRGTLSTKATAGVPCLQCPFRLTAVERNLALRHQLPLYRPRRDLRSRMEAQLAADVFDMTFHRPLCDHQTIGHVTVAHALRDHGGDL